MLSADNMVLIDVVPPRVVVSGQHSVWCRISGGKPTASPVGCLLRFNGMDHARFPPA
jgi:hypothetical protein